jgi:hypothetical protein
MTVVAPKFDKLGNYSGHPTILSTGQFTSPPAPGSVHDPPPAIRKRITVMNTFAPTLERGAKKANILPQIGVVGGLNS